MDTSVVQFYTTLFVLATDVMDMLGVMVWQRFRQKAEHREDGKFVSSLPGLTMTLRILSLLLLQIYTLFLKLKSKSLYFYILQMIHVISYLDIEIFKRFIMTFASTYGNLWQMILKPIVFLMMLKKLATTGSPKSVPSVSLFRACDVFKLPSQY